MRKLILVIVGLVLIGGVLLATAAFSLNRIIAGNRDTILQRAAAAVGRGVRADQIAVSLWGGLGVRLENVRIADDPGFSESEFVRATAVTARARLWPLLHGELEVRRIDVKQPEIQLIRDASGHWNYATLHPRSSAQRVVPSALFTGVAYATLAPAEPLRLPVSRVTIDDGTLVIIDRTRTPEQTTRVERINLTASTVSPATPISFRLEAALQRDVANLHVRGTVGPLQNHNGVPLELEGSLGPFGSQDVRLDDVRLVATVTSDMVRVAQLDGHAFDGTFSLTGQYPLGREGDIVCKGQLTNIRIAKVLQLTMADAPQRMDGSGQLALDLHASGGTAEATQSSLAGTVVVDVADGVIKDFNVVNEVLGGVTSLPGIGDLVSASVKPKYARLFSDPSTRFEVLHGSFRIAEQRSQTDDLTITARDFGVRATGWVAFNREMDLSGSVSMSQRFSADVVADVKEAKLALDDKGQLSVPFRLRGTIGEAKPRPDVGPLVARLAHGIAHGGAKDLIEKLFGGKPKPRETERPGDQVERRLRDLLGH